MNEMYDGNSGSTQGDRNENSPALYALDRARMLNGQSATFQRFTAPSLSGFPFQEIPPADLDGAAAPPAGRPGGAGRGPGGPRAGIDHACMSMNDFDPAIVTQLLVGYGLKKQEGQGRGPLVTYISLRMPNRGGAEGGTPELYFTDPDGLAIQLQDVKYCGGGGLLGELCPPLPLA